MYEEEAAKNPKFKTIYDEWKKFRAEEAQWFALDGTRRSDRVPRRLSSKLHRAAQRRDAAAAACARTRSTG